ncbi:MarR family transcriptional regulator [Streptomyces sp. SID4919]|uniref:MarR family transcriptional regulator n=1 Tax=unclassified Streptomyces TaxID=2593676 RepID=UPI000823E7D8|nr:MULTISPECIES: MarR family transcriptional regulator [unclassified Streptomyces]MYY13312.1 MarR family transcriptional regulator [Streptomyces sp. SID4919]SCK61846.1 Winged helix DNA-binding domain [Streptomyces sp. AmelKG-E11A]
MTTVPSTSTSTEAVPAADARVLGLAHYAARGVLEHVLARHGLTFQEQIVLHAAATADAPRTPDDLVTEVQGSLKAAPAALRATLGELLVKRLLVQDGAHLRPTDAGRELLAAARAELAPAAARVWGGIPAGDLAAAGRVLALVTERANAELAALDA